MMTKLREFRKTLQSAAGWANSFRESRRRGQSMVEFGFIAFPFFILVFGIIEFSYAIFAYSATQNAAHEGARRGMVLNRIQTSGASGNSFFGVDGNQSRTYLPGDAYLSTATCDAQTIAATIKCNERAFLPTSSFTVRICAPTAGPVNDFSACPCPGTSCSTQSASTPVLDGNYVQVQVEYQYRPLITFPVPSGGGFTMRAFARTQTQ
jgi:Flp pilus assembly protein TadG